MKKTSRQRADTAIRISSADYERLADLAEAVAGRTPQIAETLLQEIERAAVVPAGEMPAGIVTMNAEVTFRDEHTGKVQTVRLVYPGEADIEAGRVSVLTPIGTALLGLSEGQRIGWQTRGGEARELTVVSVRTTPGA